MIKVYFILLYYSLFGLCVFPALAEKKKSAKVLPSYLQKAYVIQKDSIVYTRPDFDSMQVSSIPAGTLVTVSKKVYRPKTRFGTFYRVYITQPKKMRAYVSEIDVVPRYVKSGSKIKVNPEFDQVKKKLKYVKDFQFNSSEPEDSLELSDKEISDLQFIGLVFSYSWQAYKSKDPFFPTWFFGLKLTGPSLPISSVATDISVMFSFEPPVINGKILEKGYLLVGDFLFKIPLFEVPHFLLSLSGGVMGKLKGAVAPADPAISQVGAGLAGAASLILRIHDRLSFLAEGKIYYDISESKPVPAAMGGLLVSF